MRFTAICQRRRRRSASSRAMALPPWRCVLRCCPTPRQAWRAESRNTPAGSQRHWGHAPGSEVSRRSAGCASRRNKIPLLRRSLRLEHRVLQHCFCQQFLEPGILLILQDEPFGLFDLNPSVLLPSALVRWLRQVDQAVVVGDRLALGDKLLDSFELADDLLRCVHGAFHGGGSDPVCQDKVSHSPLDR